MLRRSEVLARMKGMNLKALAEKTGLNYAGVYNLSTRGTASYTVIEALSDYFEVREKEIMNSDKEGE